MIKKITLFLILFGMLSCSSDDDGTYQPIDDTPPIDTPSDNPNNDEDEVNFDIEQVPYETLSEYHFFSDNMADFNPVEKVLPYDLITPLFTDYAKKKRFIWMPQGVAATYISSDKVLNFPNRTVLIKSFYYNQVQPNNQKKIIETRVMFKKNGVWEFANYVWNDDQSEAFLDLEGSNTSIDWIDEDNVSHTINYRIPSATECLVCHKSNEEPIPIGPKPQHINKNFAYPTVEKNQLQQLVDVGYLQSFPDQIETVVDWEDETETLRDRVRSYVDINCAHCHSAGAHCDYRPLRLAFKETVDDINLGICVEPDQYITSGLPYIVAAGNAQRSMMFYRMNAVDEAVKMPLLGRSIVHQESVDLLSEWIDTLNQVCP